MFRIIIDRRLHWTIVERAPRTCGTRSSQKSQHKHRTGLSRCLHRRRKLRRRRRPIHTLPDAVLGARQPHGLPHHQQHHRLAGNEQLRADRQMFVARLFFLFYRVMRSVESVCLSAQWRRSVVSYGGQCQSSQAIKLFQITLDVNDFQTLNNSGSRQPVRASKN